jgi:hypothetical protein
LHQVKDLFLMIWSAHACIASDKMCLFSLLCCLAGNVWFDYPAVNKLGCFTRSTIHALRALDTITTTTTQKAAKYDWANFDASLGVCLRLSKQAFAKVPAADVFLQSPPSKLLRQRNGTSTLWERLGLS